MKKETKKEKVISLKQFRKYGAKGGKTTSKRVEEGLLPSDHYINAGSKGGTTRWTKQKELEKESQVNPTEGESVTVEKPNN